MKPIAMLWITGALLAGGCASTQQAPLDVASDGQAVTERSEPFPEYGPLEYRPLTFDLRESRDRDRPRVHLVITNRFAPLTKLRIVDSHESQWPIRARLAPRPEHLIDTSYTIPSDVLDVEN